MIAGRIPQTLLMVGTAIIIAAVVGTILGAIAGWKTGTRFDSIIVSLSLGMYAVPTFVLGIILLLFFALYLGIFPWAG